MTGTDAEPGQLAPDLQAAPLTGDLIRIGAGPLEGVEGIVVERRGSGRYLIELSDGVYVETDLLDFSLPTP